MVKVIGRSGVELELDESTAASLVKQGVATYADAEDGEPDAESTPDSAEVPEPGESAESDMEAPPATDAPKTAWVEYATRVHGARFSEASKLTKDELIARYGQPAGAGESEEDQP